MKRFNLIREVGNGTYLDCYDEFQVSLKNDPSFNDVQIKYCRRSRLKRFFLKLIILIKGLKRILRNNGQSTSISLLMGGGFEILIPEIFRHQYNYVYIFDAWPRFHDQIEREAKALNIRSIFFSSKEITDRFKNRNSNIKCYWIPEGIDLRDYYTVDLFSKTTDVLEFGRKFQNYHEKIRPVLESNGYKHLYEKQAGDVIFKTRKQFVEGLAEAKISVCVPSNISHPERSEGISSLTLRYLQSMASKCLIVGIMPEEMKCLFDYNPIISIDIDKPADQILEILDNYNTYLPLIEKNYLEVTKKHTWANRLEKISDIIENEQ